MRSWAEEQYGPWMKDQERYADGTSSEEALEAFRRGCPHSVIQEDVRALVWSCALCGERVRTSRHVHEWRREADQTLRCASCRMSAGEYQSEIRRLAQETGS